MKRKTITLAWLLILLVPAWSCASPEAEAPLPSPTTTRALTPFSLSTITPTSAFSGAGSSTPEARLPTPTPFTHIIQEGDTLSALAYRYSTTVDQILAANPDANSNFLVIGEKLVIPIGEGENQANLPTATPVAAALSEPVCYMQRDGSGACIVRASNPLQAPIENLSALVSLFDADGNRISAEIAYAPLNLLAPGQEIPLYAYFPGPLPDLFQADAALLTALPGTGDTPGVILSVQEITFGSLQKTARVRGTAQLAPGSGTAGKIWVVGIAYSAQDQVAGMRKWEISGAFSGEDEVDFDFTILSLGPPIERVDVLSEAVP